MFFLLALVLVFVLPSPWNIVGLLVSLLLFGGEVTFWHRRVRGRRAQVGAETLIGERATVLRTCRPDGQVRLRGEIWEARCPDGADRGDTVVVVAQDALRLVVAPASAAQQSP